jgi:hypothetical protein
MSLYHLGDVRPKLISLEIATFNTLLGGTFIS